MKIKVRKIGLTLVLSSLALGLVAIFAGGYLVFKVTEDSVIEDNVTLASRLAARLRILGAGQIDDAQNLNEIIMTVGVERFGASWIMDSDGFLVAHTDPSYSHGVERKTYVGDMVVKLQSAKIPAHKLEGNISSSQVRLLELSDRFDGGFGTYDVLGDNRVIAFRAIKDKGWLVAVDQPSSTAFSELRRIKNIILAVSGAAVLLILGFTLFATQAIIKPFYRDVEERNDKLTLIREDLEGSKKDLENTAASMARMYDLSIAMQYSGYLESHLPLVLGVIQERFAFDRILLFMPDDSEQYLRCSASVGNVFEPEEKIMVPISDGGGALAKVYNERKAIFLSGETELNDEFRLSPPYSSILALRSNSFAVFPLISKERIVGVLGVDNKLTRRPLVKEDLGNVENYSYKLAAMIDNTLHFQILKGQSTDREKRDLLTGLYNLTSFKDIAEEEFSRSAGTGGPVSMALFHIANFKEYNRLNGYKRGDFVLKKFGDFLSNLETEKVTSGRCYGATMAALFRDRDFEQATGILDKLEKEFDQFTFYGEKKLTESKLVLKSVIGKYSVDESPCFDEFFQSLEAEIFKV